MKKIDFKKTLTLALLLIAGAMYSQTPTNNTIRLTSLSTGSESNTLASDDSNLNIDGSGVVTITDATPDFTPISASGVTTGTVTLTEALNKTFFMRLKAGLAIDQVSGTANYGNIVTNGGIDRSGTGDLGVRPATGTTNFGIENGEGLVFGFAIPNLPANVRLQITRIYFSTFGTGVAGAESALVVNRVDTSKSLSVLSPASGSTLIADVSSLGLIGTGGSNPLNMVSISNNSGTAQSFRVTNIEFTLSIAAPTITSLTSDGTNVINQGCAGSTLVIRGTNLLNASAVTVNGVNVASFVVTNNTTITAVLPAGATTGVVAVTTSVGTASSGNFTVNTNTATGSESVTECGSSYTWATSGATYTASGTYTFVSGCNTATLTLTLTPATTTGSESVSACGTSYTWATSGATYTASGTYTHVVGCNTATLTLTLTPATTTGSESVSECGSSYTWATSGATYTASGTYTHVVGCNTATLTLTLTPATTTGSESVTECGSSYTWATSGATYTASGTYTHVV